MLRVLLGSVGKNRKTVEVMTFIKFTQYDNRKLNWKQGYGGIHLRREL